MKKAIKSFSGGILSPIMRGRDEFAAGAIDILNMIPTLQGPAVRRGGTEFVAELNGVERIEEFARNEENAYVVCFADEKIKIFDPANNVFEEIESPYETADISKLWCYQIQDVMWITCESYAPRKLTVDADGKFVLEEVAFKNGPFLPQNITETTLSLSGTTLTASADLFTQDDVGRWVYLKTVASSTTKACSAKIVAVTDAKTATVAEIDGEFHAGSPTKIFRLGVFNAKSGWPEIAVIHQQRFVCVKKGVVYFSKTDAYTDFSISKEDGVVYTDNGFRVELAVEKGSDVQFIVSSVALVVGTGAYIYQIRSTSLGEALTPSNATYSRVSDKGACGIKPVVLEDGFVYADIFRRSAFFTAFSSVSEEYVMDDLARLARVVTDGKIKFAAFCRSPVPVLWFCKKDGALVGCTFSPKEKVCAWFKADVGGEVVSICALPNIEKERNELYLVVSRGEKQYLEKMDSGLVEEAKTSAEGFFVDCGSRFSFDEPVKTVFGLDRFIGRTIQILADGAPQPEQIVAEDGSVSLNPPAKSVVAGYGFDSYVVCAPLRISEDDELSTKRITKVDARLFKSVGMSAGVGDEVVFQENSFRSTEDRMDQSVPLYTGDYSVYTGGFTGKDAIVWVGQNQPLPLTVLAVYVDVSVSGG